MRPSAADDPSYAIGFLGRRRRPRVTTTAYFSWDLILAGTYREGKITVSGCPEANYKIGHSEARAFGEPKKLNLT